MRFRRALMPIARTCYRAIPSRALRGLAFRTLARAIGRRRTTANIDGLRFDLDLGEMIDLNVFLQQYEPDVTAAIRRYTRPETVVFDIGANVGAHTLLLAKLVGPLGRVAAFEAAGYAFAKLQRNLALNSFDWVVPVHLALSDSEREPQTVDFRSSWPTSGPRKDGLTTVAFGTLDRWCEENGVEHVDLIKIDVDGNEFPAIRGAQRILEKSKPLMVMEAVGPHFDDEARNPYRLLEPLGYSFRDLATGAETTIEEMRARLPRNDHRMTVSFNVLAVPPAMEPV